jgi:glycosyltransferase involved in cell wall biosynthesis
LGYNAATMKIACFFATSGHSGVDRLVGHLVPGFVAAGHKVDLLQIRNHGPYLQDLPEGVDRIDLGSSHVGTALLPLVSYLRRARPAVLLCDKYRVNRVVLLARWLARAHTRIVVRVGTTVSVDLASRPRVQRWVETLWMRLLYPHADAVITPSRGASLDLARVAGLPEVRVRTVESPLITRDLEEKAAQTADHPWLVDKDRPVFLGVGELSPRKDFATLIRAFARVRAGLAARLIILGDGGQRGNLLALARELGVADDVSLPGFTRNPYAFMARADGFALSSRWEGMPVVLIEALAVGTPVVSTDCPSGPREILQEGRYGMLVPVGDDARLAHALAALLRNPPAREILHEAARPYGVAQATRAYLRAMDLEPDCSGVATLSTGMKHDA